MKEDLHTKENEITEDGYFEYVLLARETDKSREENKSRKSFEEIKKRTKKANEKALSCKSSKWEI